MPLKTVNEYNAYVLLVQMRLAERGYGIELDYFASKRIEMPSRYIFKAAEDPGQLSASWCASPRARA